MDRAPDEAFMSQEGGGQHRDAQGKHLYFLDSG